MKEIKRAVHREILPCGQGRIESVKISPSLLMIGECFLGPFRINVSSRKVGPH